MKAHRVTLIVAVLLGMVQVQLDGGSGRALAEDQGKSSAAIAASTLPQVLKIADFEEDVNGFQGGFQRDATEAKQGKASGKLENKDKPWIEASKDLVGIEHDFRELRFWAKSQEAKTLTMRLIDNVGHNYQQRLPIEPDGNWHLFTITKFNQGQAWGGTQDGKWVGPPKNLTFVLEGHGTLWIDGIEATLDANFVPSIAARRELLAKAKRLVIGDFERDLDGFQGAFQRDTAEAKTGKASAKLENKDKPWIEAAKELTGLDRDFLELRFWAKSQGVETVTLRLIDKAGHNYQQRLPIQADGPWHHFTVQEFNKGQAWGGSPDGKWVGPPQSLAFVLESKGTLWIDGVEAALSPELPPAAARRDCAAKAQPLVIADFEQDLDGFQGAFVRDSAEAKQGKASARLENKDKPWIESQKAFASLENDFVELRFWVMSRDSKTITMRLIDKVGHNYQQRFTIKSDGTWQQIVISEFNKGQAWGGPADGKWVGPPQSIAFILEGKGTIWVDGIEALLDQDRSVEFFRMRPKVFGNVFLASEPVEIPIETQAARLDCNVTDFWSKEVCRATAITKDHLAVLALPVNARGHFTAHVRLLDAAGAAAGEDRSIDFAVVEAVDLSKLRESPFGGMTHFSVGWDTAIVPLIARAGLATVRDEAFWAGVEAEKGVFNFEKYDRYLSELKRNGIQPLIALTFTNPHYDNGNTPYTAEGCQGYGRYAQELLKHYGEQIRWLEVWNEYNGSFCGGPAAQDRPRYYTQMCKAAYQAIKEVRPDVTVLGAAVVSVPLPYFEAIFKQGGLDAMDAVVIHPYRGRPEGVENDIAELRQLIKKYNRGQEKPIWATEYGFAGKEPYEMARYLVRMSALMRSEGVERMYWYLTQDFNEFKGMGLIHDSQDPRAYSPAPAYSAMAAMIRLLHDARFVEREASHKYSRTYVLKFIRSSIPSSAGEEVRVCWATHPSKIHVESDGPLARVDLMGNSQTLTPQQAATLEVGETPFYLVGKAKRVTEMPSGPTIVADLAEDYSKTQGANGWYYGYADDAGRDFKPFHLVVTPWGEHWAGPLPYLEASRGCLHPQVRDGKAVLAVQRWKSPLAGSVQVKGHFDRDRNGDGCTVLVLVDGKRVFEQHAGGPQSPTRREFALELNVKEGTLVDFAVTPGPNNNLDFDITMVDAQILLNK